MKIKSHSKAQIGIDAIFSFIVFLGSVLLIIAYINSSLGQSNIKNQQIFEQAAFVVENRLESFLTESIFLIPLSFSNFNNTIPIEFYYNFSFYNFNPNASVILDKNHNIVPLDIYKNKISFIADEMQKPYFLIAIPNNASFNKTPISYETDLNSENDYINNSLIYVKFKNQGMESLKFNNNEILTNNKILLSTNSIDNISSGNVKAIANFDNKKIIVYKNNSLIKIISDNDFDSQLYFRNYDYFYNGAENDFNDSYSGSVWSGNIDLIDLYDKDDGVAIIGKNMNINISNDFGNYRKIEIINANNYKIIPHNGNYETANMLKQKYLDDVNASLGASNEIKGTNCKIVNETFSTSYFDLKNQLGLFGADINISIVSANASFGLTIPNNKHVFAYNFPIIFIDRFANKSINLMKFAIWR